MANAFKKFFGKAVGTANSTVYNPSTPGIQSTIIGLSLCNITSSQVNVSITVTTGGTANASSNTVHLIKDVVLPPGTTLTPVGGNQKLVLTANSSSSDYLEVRSSGASSVDVIVSALEIT